MICSSLLASTAAVGASANLDPLQSRFVFEAHVTVGAPLTIGPATVGLRRVVPITGGTVSGPRLSGKVVPGGADWQFARSDGVLAIEAKYTLQSHDGMLIMVTNRGMRHGPAEVIEKLVRGEKVDAKEYYFRTAAEFEAPADSPYAWLNKAVFIGVAERTSSAAIVRFYEVL